MLSAESQTWTHFLPKLGDKSEFLGLGNVAMTGTVLALFMDENFLGKPTFPGFSNDFRLIFLVKITPQFILSTLKCNNMTPKARPYNPARSLRSESKHLLSEQCFRLKSFGGRAFSTCTPPHDFGIHRQSP
jgi:hypothetical protein